VRIVFFGSGEFGLPTLTALTESHDVALVVSQPDRPAGRRRRPTPTPVAAWTAEQAPRIPLFQPPDVNEAAVCNEIRAVETDAWIVIAFGQKLGQPLLADRFAINLHASLLPRWRGAAPINHAILAGDAETGNSVITVTQRMDAGLLLARTRRAIDPLLTAGELHNLLAADGPPAVLETLQRKQAGTLEPEEQDESLVTKAPKLTKSDGWIDFAQPAEICRRRVHGLTPWPGVPARLGDQSLKLHRVQAGAAENQEAPGTILDAESGLVACGQSTALRLLEVQPSGKRVMPWADFVRGRAVHAGDTLEGNPPC